ncbi:hybrid sensor histidine kinase/response regulator [Leisingera sp. ANG-M7]|uniref:hybrid sensor histidine kinase/response regulator n=1 Tax=Leisingera sp. ANG-M7 TaxID=1577902 RepID=UPI00057F6B40|nr:ATP-binding protein [Leisingera sp. ANG-M7]KIC35778.1 histidine kinase [Leisingera sp. ANG-M7]
MNIGKGPVDGPLASYERKYSSFELMMRYAKGRSRTFWPRQVFVFGVCVLLGLATDIAIAAMAFAAALIGDIADSYCLWRLPALAAKGFPESKLRLLTTFSAAVYGAGMSICATLPYWPWVEAGMGSDHHLDLLFSIAVLAGIAMNAAITFPYHRAASLVWMLYFCTVPGVMLWVDSTVGGGITTEWLLHAAGVATLTGYMFWLGAYGRRTFENTRQYNLATATQQQELEAANARLQEQQMAARRLALVAENANDSVMLMDREGRITWVNDSFTRITGYSSEEALGQMPGDLLNSGETDPGTIKLLQDSIRYAQPVRVEIRNRCKDGRKVWIETSQVPMLNSDGKLETLIAVERDITAAKENARQLEKARAAAEEGARAKSDFLATMSHEIRTPMNGVIGMAQLLRDSGLNEDQALYADTILSSADMLLALINDVLDFSKMDAEELTLSPVNFDPRTCFETTIRLLQAQADAKGLELALEIQEDLPAHLHGDDRRIRQILMNLAGNAIKFTKKGRVSVSLGGVAAAGGYELTFTVTDTGIGIAEEKLGDVFERFSQADAAISRRFGGTGLGLAISRRLAEAMGGSIAVSSKLGTGSCFAVRLHLQDAQAGNAAQPEPADARDPSALGGLRVLVAEDNAVNRLLVEKFLSAAPVELAFARDGREAVAQFESFAPDVILMDMSMPDMDGLEATRAIRALVRPQPVIVALTANAFDSDRKACLAAGMDDFMSKPISKPKLLDLLARLAPQAQSRRAG